jgi:hypothetical protein
MKDLGTLFTLLVMGVVLIFLMYMTNSFSGSLSIPFNL